MEIFKQIEGFEGYRVSNLGRVMNSKGKYMKFYETRGYQRIDLSKKGKVVKCQVHRLVLEAFGKKMPGMTVHHINHVRNDNRLENLMWMTHIDNLRNKSNKKRKYFRDRIKELYNSGQCESVDEFYQQIMKL